MPPAHRGPTGSPMDRWTDASSSAVASGFQTAMSLGPQPRLDFTLPASGLSQTMTSVNFNTDDEDEDDDEDDVDAGSPANMGTKKANGKGAKAKKGAAAAKSKDAKAAQHRKEQNRAAQREFRQRKQQYIRALEARVELLSSDHDTQVNRLRFALRHLLAENNSLRGIVGSLANFIGSRAIGGCLVEAGMTREMLEATMGSSSEKVMSEAWANWPGAGECEALQEIRKQSNIPPEGLPESKLLNYFRVANNKSAPDASGDATADKKKRTVDDAANKDPKRKRTADETLSSTEAAPDTATASSNKSSPSTRPNLVGAGQNMPHNNDVNHAWQHQQPQQQQMPYALPSQFWQPYQSGLTQESMFAQTLLGGGNPDLQNLASIFPNAGNLFPPQHQASFGGQMPNAPANFDFLGFGPQIPAYTSTPSNIANATASTPPSRATGGVQSAIVPSGSRAFPEHLRALRRRSARVIAQVNRIWAKRGSTCFLNMATGNQLDEDDMRFLEEQESSNPHIKIACTQLPNNWDEGDLSGAQKTRYDTENKVENFLQLWYHLYNRHLNPNYSLPPILKPTPLQQSTPHDQAIDSLPFPSIRDKLIQMPGLDLHSVCIDLVRFLCQSDGDINSERNWVLGLPFWIRYPQLADAGLLANTNRQRRENGEQEVTMDDVWKEHQQFKQHTQAILKELS
ncbi:uncharacterized protein MEPE_01728 [Melanopsichium pennsylvanicum]|uniref:BZIP domain-containing protein n=2 Tax=Melanopsichium pennsylvanicum TaxID=63383 RepID=A0AAJ4XJ78_9BASI|nr:uncharacterized protein BN887_04644 [Melanopsichium pennsylvanicum 4]SNX83022.1 uncharacterized protein MEPE_01728 [Melanopsichium pennsylvanicum]